MLLILFYIYRQSVQLSFLMSIVSCHCYFVVFLRGGGRVSRGNRGQLKSCLQMRVWLMLFLELDQPEIDWDLLIKSTGAKVLSRPVADPGEGPGGPGRPFIFRPKWGPKDRTIFFEAAPLPHPLILGSGWPAPALSEGWRLRSGSTTGD